MHFLSPIWLVGLLPWLAAAIYLSTGRHEPASVPFLALWRGSASPSRVRRDLHCPPLFILLILLAMLLGVLIAAGPALSNLGTNVVVILDRGITMSPASEKGDAFRGVIAQAAPILAKYFSGPIELQPVPGTAASYPLSNWSAKAEAMPPTALDTRALVQQAVAGRLKDSHDILVVLTDRQIGFTDDRVVQIPPSAPVNDVGITHIAARSRPLSQVMVQVRRRGASPTPNIHLRITTGDHIIERTVPLPADDAPVNYFFDLPKDPGPTLVAELTPGGDAKVNDRAWLVREKYWPTVESQSSLPPSVQRMIEVYNRARPARAGSTHIAISTGELPPADRGVWLINAGAGAGSREAAGASAPPVVSPHSVTDHVEHWPGPATRDAKSPAGFEPMVINTGQILVAIKEGEVRQAWLNLDLGNWSLTPDFVIFFTNLFDWLGDVGQDEYTAHPPSALAGQWSRADDSPAPANTEPGLWPGLYRRSDGVLRAINAPDASWDVPPAMAWQEKLGHLQARTGDRSLRPELSIAAILCITAATASWPRKTRPKAFP